MANKPLAQAESVNSMLRSNSVLVEIDGAVRRITLDKLMDAINENETELLRQVAWGVPLKETSNTNWGVVGNRLMWEEYKSHIGRYFLHNSGKAAKLSRTNSALFADGTAVDQTKGHIMFHGPSLYYLVQTDAVNNIPILWMSQLPIGGHVIDDEHTTFGAYKASMSGSALVSRGGVAPAGARTIESFWTAAQVNGDRFGLTDYTHRLYMMMLLLSEFGCPNAQTKVGYGVCGSTSVDVWSAAQNLLTGATAALGDETGKIDITVTNGNTSTTNASRVNLFGIEDAWGWQWEMIQGIFYGNSNNAGQDGTEIFIYEGNRMPSAAELASHPEGTFRQKTRLTTSGYTSKMELGEYFDLIAKTLSGGSDSYWTDYNYNSATGQLCLWGGYADSGAACGLACSSSHLAWSTAASYSGARLAYYGPLEIVTGSELMAEIA